MLRYIKANKESATMAENGQIQELYRIINRAVSRCTNHENTPVNTEISIYQSKIAHHKKHDGQLSIFADDSQLYTETAKAADFCDCLEEYRQSVDLYASNAHNLSEHRYRKLLKGIEHFRPQIYSENMYLLKALEYNCKRQLPEYHDKMLLEEYNRQALRIRDMKKGYDRQRRQNQKASKDYEKDALYFFKEVMNNEELRRIKGCAEKLSLYENCLNIVDCLPAEKYNRSAKFKLKKDFNYAIRITAATLSRDANNAEQAKRYEDISKKAEYEENRYAKALERVKEFTEKPQKYKGRTLSIEARNRRAKEEWDYR